MADKIRVLLAEDEPSLAFIIKESLETRDFLVSIYGDGEEALAGYRKDSPQILILDVMMPKKDGFTLAKEIRLSDRNTPIIFLTAKSQTSDVVEGFQHGGNDYLKKPFSMEELIVRVHALLNRLELPVNHKEGIAIGQYVFNYTRQSLKFNEEEEQLTHREAEVLLHLYKSRNEVVDKSVLLKELWGDDDFFSGRSLDVFITKLRKKLTKDDKVLIVNSRGYGYKLLC
ncbi:response regulator transcription factor [Flavobacterium cerinum]|uniref:Response regulator transcription factor n=1 Tax=Flavobacterium cerinum TaxID=2502784 RepID=A0A444H0E3_9FLAO|nr:response regulator transcription factor [Flavobacterium cerinum]RWW96721.1 response regulator transcription factor [Flavobacterium cerinum]